MDYEKEVAAIIEGHVWECFPCGPTCDGGKAIAAFGRRCAEEALERAAKEADRFDWSLKPKTIAERIRALKDARHTVTRDLTGEDIIPLKDARTEGEK